MASDDIFQDDDADDDEDQQSKDDFNEFKQWLDSESHKDAPAPAKSPTEPPPVEANSFCPYCKANLKAGCHWSKL